MNNEKSIDKSLAIGYRGDVKFSTYIGKHLLSTKTYRNAGALPLFQFLANCLAGNFPAAYQNRPYKIKLLKANAERPSDLNMPTDVRGNNASCSSLLSMTSAPAIIIQDSAEMQACKVTFSFIFPQNSITESGANIIAMYGPGITDQGEYCAYYKLTRESVDASGGIETVWDPIIIDPDDDEANKIYAVEWTMTLANQKTEKGA